MTNEYDRTDLEETDDGLTVRLAEGARLIRLGPSLVVIAKPVVDGETSAMMQVKTTVGCSCVNGKGTCLLKDERTGPSSIRIWCESQDCETSCSKITVDSGAWETVRWDAVLASSMPS